MNREEQITRREFLRGQTESHRGRERRDQSPGYSYPDYRRRSDQRNSSTYRSAQFSEDSGAWHQDENGLYKGKGPRSYQRRDERILEDISDRICDNPYLDASEVEVEVTNGEVILKGEVNDRESKRLAEDIGESVPGVRNVENRLRITKTGI
jgi:osmotically-inducible protein OsmY